MVDVNAESSHRRVSTKHNPSFIQPFFQLENSTKLRIPLPFIKNFKGNIPDKVSLQNMSGMIWPARLRCLDDNLYIRGGWCHFAREHDLRTGDLMVFQYLPPSTFLVMALGPDGCNKPEPLVKENRKSNAMTYDVSKMRFYRVINNTKRNFVTVPRPIIDECVVNLPEKVEVSFEGRKAVKRKLMRVKDRLVLGYSGMYRFWERFNVQKGDQLEFQIVRRDDNTIKKINVKKMG